MKFKINRQVLLANLNKVQRAVNSKNPYLALTGIKFTLQDDQLELIGSNNDLSIRCIIKKGIQDEQVFEIEETGSAVINEKIICDIIKKIDSDVVEIMVTDNTAKIKSENSIFNINTIPSTDYPSFDFTFIGQPLSMDALELKTVLDQTLFACSDKESRPILTGLNISCSNNKLEFVATDTYRLSKKIVDTDYAESFRVTIAKVSLDEINRIIELGSLVHIYITDKKATFDLGDCTIITRLINGTYPDTSRLIPEQFDQILTINNSSLINSVDRVSILLNERNDIVKLNMKEDEVFISSKNSEAGSAIEKISAEDYGYEGNPLIISFSGHYLTEAARALNSEEISLHFTGDMKPIIIKSKTNSNLIQLILPVRTYN